MYDHLKPIISMQHDYPIKSFEFKTHVFVQQTLFNFVPDLQPQNQFPLCSDIPRLLCLGFAPQ